MVGSDNRFHNRQADAAALPFALARGVDAIETVKQARQMLGGNRRTGVLHHQAYRLRAFAQLDGHRLPGRRIADRIRQQVADCPPQHQRIARHPAGATDKAQRHRLLFRPRLEKLKHLMHFIGQIQRLLLRDQLVIIRLSEEQHIADHPRHPRELFEIGVQHLFQLLLAAALA